MLHLHKISVSYNVIKRNENRRQYTFLKGGYLYAPEADVLTFVMFISKIYSKYVQKYIQK